MPLFHAHKRLYLTADDRVVEAGDPDAHQLLVPAGGTLPFQVAARYGLVTAPEHTPAAPPKAMRQAPADKMARRAHTKG